MMQETAGLTIEAGVEHPETSPLLRRLTQRAPGGVHRRLVPTPVEAGRGPTRNRPLLMAAGMKAAHVTAAVQAGGGWRPHRLPTGREISHGRALAGLAAVMMDALAPRWSLMRSLGHRRGLDCDGNNGRRTRR